MRRALVSDVMTRDVVTFTPDTSFHDIVTALAERGISGAPVLSPDGRVLGVVSEADVLRKEEFKSPLEDHPSRFETRRRAEERRRAVGHTAAEIMNTPAVTVTLGSTAIEAARLMAVRSVKRLPVVGPDGTLAGIVTRGDLMRVFLRSDEEILAEVTGEVLQRYLGQDLTPVRVDVKDGVVTLTGTLDQRSLIPVAVRLAGAVEGVARVVDHLAYAEDDTLASPPPMK